MSRTCQILRDHFYRIVLFDSSALRVEAQSPDTPSVRVRATVERVADSARLTMQAQTRGPETASLAALITLAAALEPQPIAPRAPPLAAPPGIRPGARKYSAQVDAGNERQELGVRTVTVSATDSGIARAWLVVMTMQIDGKPFIDSVVMRRAEQRAVSRHMIAGGADLLIVADDSVAHGLLTMGPSLVPLNVPLPARSYLNYYSLRAALAELPLREGWTGQVSRLGLGKFARFERLELAVVGEDHITVPAGDFDCWHDTVVGRGINEHYWVDMRHQDVIRTREPIGGPGAIMQLDLVSFVPSP